MREDAFDSAAHRSGLLRWVDEFAQNGVFTTDTGLVVRSWNRWLEAATGWPAADLVGRPLFDALPELATRGFEPYYRAALAGEIKVLAQTFHRYVIAPRSLPGREIRQSGRIAPLIADGAIVGTVTVVDDVTERVLSERELRSQFEASERARGLAEEALRVKDEFLTTLSHEIRTPLNAVLGWTRILLAGADDPARLQRALEIIDRNAVAQVRLIDDMLDTARIMSGKLRLEPKVVDLGRVALAALDVVAPTAAAKGVHLHAEIADGASVSMMGDPDRLQQIIWNLLANAIKFTPGGGSVTVGIASKDGALTLTVTDTGEGIPEGFLPQLFERFRQADPSASRRHGGLGIGLSLVRQLVELHGGRIAATSTEGQGSRFVVTFPSRPELVEAAELHEHGAPTLEHIHVLVIDADTDGRELLVAALQQQGADVTAVAHATDALALLERPGAGKRPDVLVADVRGGADSNMPLLERLRAPAENRFMPAVAVLAQDNPGERARAHAAGFRAHLAKPLSPRALAHAVRSALGSP